MGRPRKDGGINWNAIKLRFERNEQLDAIARQFGVKRDAIMAHGLEMGWETATERASSNNRRARESFADTVERIASVELHPLPADYVEQHLTDWQELRRRVEAEFVGYLTLQPNERARMLPAIAAALKLIQDGQRKSLGLDKQTGGDGAGDHAAATQEIEGRVVSAD